MEKIKLAIREQLLEVRKWTRNNQKEFWILVIILTIGAFFRLYKISEYMTFLGDEGRDAIVVRRLLVDFDPILIGPRTSIGDMYLGPLYYYMMAPALLLANFSPVGPAIMIALLGVLTIFFVWYVAREWFTVGNAQGTSLHIGALIAALLYAISPVVIIYSKSSWNPNIMPFFSLLVVYSIWQAWIKKNFKWLIVAGISMAFVLQSHYLGLLLIPALGFFWFLTLLRVKGKGKYLSYSLSSVVVFLILMSPLVMFDARHGWRNFASMKRFFTERQTTISLKPWKAIPGLWPIIRDNFITRIIAGYHPVLGKWTSIILLWAAVLLAFSLLYGLITNKDQVKRKASACFLLFTWILFGLVGMGLYKQHVYDHYFGFLFPAPFLLIGALSEQVSQKSKDGIKIFFGAGLVLIVVTNLMNNPLWGDPNFQLKRAKEVAKRIQKEAEGKKFNLAVIAERNYEDGYQYFLEKEGEKVVDIDAQLPETITDQLFVVCELPEKQCDPTHNPKAEIANFGWSGVENRWKVEGVVVYKLVHTQ